MKINETRKRFSKPKPPTLCTRCGHGRTAHAYYGSNPCRWSEGLLDHCPCPGWTLVPTPLPEPRYATPPCTTCFELGAGTQPTTYGHRCIPCLGKYDAADPYHPKSTGSEAFCPTCGQHQFTRRTYNGGGWNQKWSCRACGAAWIPKEPPGSQAVARQAEEIANPCGETSLDPSDVALFESKSAFPRERSRCIECGGSGYVKKRVEFLGREVELEMNCERCNEPPPSTSKPCNCCECFVDVGPPGCDGSNCRNCGRDH